MPVPTATKAKATPVKPRKKKPAAADVAPTIVHPDIRIEVCRGDAAVTGDRARELIGWAEVDSLEAGASPELKKLLGLLVKLANNSRNRFIIPSWLLTLRQEHLQGRWRFNGETIVIGQSGQVLSGQHRLLSLILACLEWEAKRAHWETVLPAPPVMETVIVYGVPEDDDVFKTLNCGKTATLTEVLYRSETFAALAPDSRRTCSKMADYAVKLLWDRTGAKEDPFAPRRTHGEAIDFINRHPRLKRAVKHVFEENQAKRGEDGKNLPVSISRYVPPGSAAAMLYLMGSSRSDGDQYRVADIPSEKDLVWDDWDIACDFWTKLGNSDPALQPVRDAIAGLADADTAGGSGSLTEKVAVICRAWAVFRDSHAVTDADLELAFADDDYGGRELSECYSFGGIDLGGPRARPGRTSVDPTEEEIAARRDEIRGRKRA